MGLFPESVSVMLLKHINCPPQCRVDIKLHFLLFVTLYYLGYALEITPIRHGGWEPRRIKHA